MTMLSGIGCFKGGSCLQEDIFEKALRFLYERRLEQLGIEADVVVTKISKKEERRDNGGERL